MPTTSIKKIPVNAQAITQTSSPQSSASVTYPLGGILIEPLLPLLGDPVDAAWKTNIPATIRWCARHCSTGSAKKGFRRRAVGHATRGNARKARAAREEATGLGLWDDPGSDARCPGTVACAHLGFTLFEASLLRQRSRIEPVRRGEGTGGPILRVIWAGLRVPGRGSSPGVSSTLRRRGHPSH